MNKYIISIHHPFLLNYNNYCYFIMYYNIKKERVKALKNKIFIFAYKLKIFLSSLSFSLSRFQFVSNWLLALFNGYHSNLSVLIIQFGFVFFLWLNLNF